MKRAMNIVLGLAALVAAAFVLPHLASGPSLFTSSAAVSQQSSKVEKLNDSNFETTLKGSKTIVLVDFYADWCGPCRAMRPNIEKIAEEFDGRVLVVKVDVDESSTTARNQRIRSIPTLRVFAAGSTTEQSTRTGYMDLDTLRKWVSDELAR